MTYTCPHCNVVFTGEETYPTKCKVCAKFLPKLKDNEMKKGVYIIGSINKTTGAFSASVNPSTHMSITLAKAEAERLAKLDQGKKFVVLKVEGIVSVLNTTWE